MLLRLHHLSLLTRRLAETTAFYRYVLGFAEIPRPKFDFAGAWLYGYGVQIHLIVNEKLPDPAENINSRAEHVAFEVDDPAPLEQLLTERGIPFRASPQASTGLRQVFFKDPDGHTIEIAAYGPTKTTGSW